MSQSQQAPKGGQSTRPNRSGSARVVDLEQQRRIVYRPHWLGGGRRPEGYDLQAAGIVIQLMLQAIGGTVLVLEILCWLTGR